MAGKFLGFPLIDEGIVYDKRHISYLNAPAYYQHLNVILTLLTEGKLSEAKHQIAKLPTISKNYKTRFLMAPVDAATEAEEIERLKVRFRLAGVEQDLYIEKIVCNDPKFIYVVTPKVASRSILRFFRNDINLKSRVQITTTPLQQLLEEKPKYKEYFKFAFVRNPFTRAISCYNDKIVPTEWETDSNGNRIPVNNSFKYFKGKSIQYPIRPNMPFDDFIEFLGSEYGGDLVADRHWLSQFVIMSDDSDSNLVDYVGKLETLDEDWQRICRELHIAYTSLSRMNSTEKKIPPTNRPQYSSRSIEVIRKRYKKDFEIFKYPTEYPVA